MIPRWRRPIPSLRFRRDPNSLVLRSQLRARLPNAPPWRISSSHRELRKRILLDRVLMFSGNNTSTASSYGSGRETTGFARWLPTESSWIVGHVFSREHIVQRRAYSILMDRTTMFNGKKTFTPYPYGSRWEITWYAYFLPHPHGARDVNFCREHVVERSLSRQ